MPGAVLNNPGITTWTDNVDNWRSADADYLQKRSNMRFANVGARTTALSAVPVEGMVSYLSSTGELQFTDSASATANVWRTVLAPRNLAVSDSVNSFGLRLLSDGSASFALEAGKVVLGPTRVVTVDTALRIKTGVATASLTTDATALVSDVQIKAPSVAATGAVTSASITNSGAITTASVAASGAVTAGSVSTTSLSVGGSSLMGAIVSGSILSGGDISAQGNLYGTQTWGGQLFMNTNYIQNPYNGAAFVRLTSIAEVTGSPVVLNSLSNLPVRYGSSAGPIIACVVASATDPNAAAYPEGTLWAQV